MAVWSNDERRDAPILGIRTLMNEENEQVPR